MKKTDEVIELLKLWYYLKTEHPWPEATTAIEDKVCELLNKEDWVIVLVADAELQ